MKLVDTHVHLYFPDYDNDREEVIQRARAEGVELFINVGTDPESSKQCLALANANRDMYATAGIHPHDAKDADEAAYDAIEALLSEERIVGIGEIGLDFFRNHSTPEQQLTVLRRFMTFYREYEKPLVIHCRDAYDALLDFLKEDGQKQYHGIMHCFSSDRDTMLKFVDYGFHISFAGPLTYKKNDSLRKACRDCPEDRVLLETDAPFLPPQSLRGKRNETAYMVETAKMAAQARGISLDEAARITTQNAKQVFGL